MCHIDREGWRARRSSHKVLERRFVSQTSLTLHTHAHAPPPPIRAARVWTSCERAAIITVKVFLTLAESRKDNLVSFLSFFFRVFGGSGCYLLNNWLQKFFLPYHQLSPVAFFNAEVAIPTSLLLPVLAALPPHVVSTPAAPPLSSSPSSLHRLCCSRLIIMSVSERRPRPLPARGLASRADVRLNPSCPPTLTWTGNLRHPDSGGST